MIKYVGFATRACIGKNSWGTPNVSQCRNMMLIRIQTENLKTIDRKRVLMELSFITATVRRIINTTIPILPNDIPVIVNILETTLK